MVILQSRKNGGQTMMTLAIDMKSTDDEKWYLQSAIKYKLAAIYH
jgi:hypothetical protein